MFVGNLLRSVAVVSGVERLWCFGGPRPVESSPLGPGQSSRVLFLVPASRLQRSSWCRPIDLSALGPGQSTRALFLVPVSRLERSWSRHGIGPSRTRGAGRGPGTEHRPESSERSWKCSWRRGCAKLVGQLLTIWYAEYNTSLITEVADEPFAEFLERYLYRV